MPVSPSNNQCVLMQDTGVCVPFYQSNGGDKTSLVCADFRHANWALAACLWLEYGSHDLQWKTVSWQYNSDSTQFLVAVGKR